VTVSARSWGGIAPLETLQLEDPDPPPPPPVPDPVAKASSQASAVENQASAPKPAGHSNEVPRTRARLSVSNLSTLPPVKWGEPVDPQIATIIAALKEQLVSQPGLQIDVSALLTEMSARCEEANRELAQGREGGTFEPNIWDLSAKKLMITRAKLERWVEHVLHGGEEAAMKGLPKDGHHGRKEAHGSAEIQSETLRAWDRMERPPGTIPYWMEHQDRMAICQQGQSQHQDLPSLVETPSPRESSSNGKGRELGILEATPSTASMPQGGMIADLGGSGTGFGGYPKGAAFTVDSSGRGLVPENSAASFQIGPNQNWDGFYSSDLLDGLEMEFWDNLADWSNVLWDPTMMQLG
jgi:hypothetical protein